MTDIAARRLKLAGAAVSILAVGYFAVELVFGIDWTEAAQIIHAQGRMLPLALFFYLAAFLPMVAGWHVALVMCGAEVAPANSARIFLVSQFAKYLPGNVGHLVGRVVLARSEGIPADTASAAMLTEIVGVLIAGCGLCLATLALGARPAAEMPLLLLASLAIALACGGMATFLLRGKLKAVRLNLSIVTGLVGLFVLVFALIGAAQMVLLFSFAAAMPDAETAMIVGSAILVSWIAGFLTPGAPAGLGVREVSLALLLQDLLASEHILLAAGGMRLVTLLGDVLMWGAGLCLPPPAARSTALSE